MKAPITIDVIILSYAKDENLKILTEQTIQTLLDSENPKEIKFNIVVIESNKNIKPFQYANSTTIYPDEKFGFHKYLNIGIKATKNKYICLCNNDLIFHRHWASEILKAFETNREIVSANPRCNKFEPHIAYNQQGAIVFANRKNIFKGVLTGWCIFVKRSIFEKIGMLDEKFDFWYADRDYGRTLLKHKLKHVLVPSSLVTHLGNQSHSSIDQDKIDDYTILSRKKYEAKWGSNEDLFTQIKNRLHRLIKA